MTDAFSRETEWAIGVGWVNNRDGGGGECSDEPGRWIPRGEIAPGFGGPPG
ncbi:MULTISPECIES: hypothetical protein [unclassified Streptomyces]|uniref:hypothetical protein n=1 Tax=unclassified Streptomyces TaxID=2593676 RepID=UPI000AB0F380|nr:hypothetical protein [Streptomyces sp. TSRI0281]